MALPVLKRFTEAIYSDASARTRASFSVFCELRRGGSETLKISSPKLDGSIPGREERTRSSSDSLTRLGICRVQVAAQCCLPLTPCPGDGADNRPTPSPQGRVLCSDFILTLASLGWTDSYQLERLRGIECSYDWS